ncbi:MAG: hypothetical protein EBY16_07590 [Gammaproteobacteria bacterium]|nr:hypothetical protein [Gammaproteobacteria bacterium]
MERCVEIGNRGGGACGYLSFAVGLVDRIKQEITKGEGPSPTLARLNAIFRNSFPHEDWYILKPDEFQRFDMSNYMSKYMADPEKVSCWEVRYIERVQRYLRTIGAKAYEKDLEAAIHKALIGNSTDLVSNPVFGQIVNIIRHLSQNNGKIEEDKFANYQHNAVVQSPQVIDFAKEVFLDVLPALKRRGFPLSC